MREQTAEGPQEATPSGEPGRVNLYIYMSSAAYEQIKKWAKYAAIEELIEGHPSGNFSGYCNFCFNLGEQYLKQYMLKKRGYK